MLTIDYELRCTACGHEWTIYGDGLFVVNLSSFDNRCNKCGCQVICVTECYGPESTFAQVDFTEQNNTLATNVERKFNEMKDAFHKLSRLAEGTGEHRELKNWLLERIKMSAFD